jgi:serine phosphatase RsbU (regulator of sigma subunit)
MELDVTREPGSGLVVLRIACRVENKGDYNGILVGTIQIDEIYPLMGDFSISSASKSDIRVNWIDGTGKLLYSSDQPDAVLKDTYERFDDIKDLQIDEVRMLDSAKEILFIAEQAGHRNYPGGDWKLILAIHPETAFAALGEIRTRFIYGTLAALVVSLIIAVVVANLFVRPIIRLSHAATKIGEGALDTQLLEGYGKDEIGTLAQKLSQTTQTLISRIEEEKQIAEKHKEEIREIESQKVDIEEMHKDVQESINYSQRIQRSMLPDRRVLNRLFKDSLLLYRPKDIVSGDFYWFERVRSGRHEHMIIVAADCTGHGVPGAIMSMIGSNQLTNIVYYQNYIDPEKILARMDKAIKSELYRDMDPDEPRHDGMEIGVCVIDLDTMELTFAGAGIPLYFVRSGQTETYKSPKVTIGQMEGTEKEAEEQFTPVKITLEAGDRLFMASDGFQDQFGGPNDKRFMARNFRNLLMVSGQDKTMSELQDKINEVFDHWKGSGDQTDDVLVLGLEI